MPGKNPAHHNGVEGKVGTTEGVCNRGGFWSTRGSGQRLHACVPRPASDLSWTNPIKILEHPSGVMTTCFYFDCSDLQIHDCTSKSGVRVSTPWHHFLEYLRVPASRILQPQIKTKCDVNWLSVHAWDCMHVLEYLLKCFKWPFVFVYCTVKTLTGPECTTCAKGEILWVQR